MIKFLFKNAAYIFLANNLIVSMVGIGKISVYVFFFILSAFLIFLLFSSSLAKNLILNKGFKLYFSLSVLNIIYYLFVEFGDIESLKYLSARILQFTIFASTIFYYGDQSEVDIGKFIKVTTLLSLIASLFFAFPEINGRYKGVFYNSNEFSVIMVYGFSSFLFLSKKSFLRLLLLSIFMIVIVMSGSRAALLAVSIALLLYYRTNLWYFFILIPFAFLLLPFLGDNNSFSRLINEDIFVNRKYEYLYAFETFLQKPLLGHGLKNYAYIDLSLIKYTDQNIDFGAHNSYLSLIVQYGFFFFTAFIYLLTISIIDAIKYLQNQIENNNSKYLLFIIIYTLVNGFFENSFSGINYFQSSMFWFVLGMVLYNNHVKSKKA
jgi:hypothetical protein